MKNFKGKVTALVKHNDFSAGALCALVIAAVVFVNIIIYTLAMSFGWFFTPEEETDFSISGSTDALFKEAIDDGLTVNITFCMYEDELKDHDTGSFVYKTVKEFENRYPDFLEIDYINVITMLDSDGNAVDIERYKTDMRGKATNINASSIIFECEGRSYYVLTDDYTGVGFADFYTLDGTAAITSYEGEEVFASMISWVLKEKHDTVYLTKGHGETANVSLRYALIRAGYYCDTDSEIDLRSGEIPFDSSRPDSAGLLIISNPRTDFERAAEGSNIKTEIEHLRSYMNSGGRLIVFLDPQTKRLPVLESFIEEYGIGIRENENGERLTVKDSSNAITVDGFTLVAEYNTENGTVNEMYSKISPDKGDVILKNAAPLKLSGAAVPVLLSSSSSVAEAEGETVDSEGSYCLAAISEKEISGGKNAKIFVVPSIFLTATDAMITDSYSNKDFLYSLFDVYFGKGDMPYGCNSIIYDSAILENLTMGTAKWLTAGMLILPAVIGIVGLAVVIRRKNR